jgi:hypothetical protein
MQIKRRRTPRGNSGYPDYFDDSHKRKMLRLAGIKSSDIFYDLGCGNASILVLAVQEFDVKKAIGVEDDSYRNNTARKRVKQEKLQGRISVDKKNMYQTDLTNADVIFEMLVEDADNMRRLYSQKIKNGARLIKHDLSPLRIFTR